MKNVIFLLLLLLPYFSQAQFSSDPPEVNSNVEVLMRDGNRLKGTVTEHFESGFYLKTSALGILPIKYHRVYSIVEKGEGKTESLSVFKDYVQPYNAHRLMLTPTANAIGRGQGYYYNNMLFFNFFGFGIGDHVSVSGGFELVSIFNDLSTTTFYLNPRVHRQFHPMMSAGVGLIYSNAGGEGFFAPNLMATFGDKRNFATINLMYNVVNQEAFDERPRNWLYTFGGQIQLTNRFFIVLDNLSIQNFDGGSLLGTFGFRIERPSYSWDFAFIYGADDDFGGIVPIPFVGFYKPFGQ